MGLEQKNLPHTPDELIQFCLEKQTIVPGLRFTPGAWMDVAPIELRAPINGVMGIEKIASTGEVIAVSGFDFGDDDTKLVIQHTPQGVIQSDTSRRGRKELLVSDFRQELIGATIDIAQSLRFLDVVGISAENHFKVKFGSVPLERGQEIIDRVYEAAGFQKKEDGNFQLDLTTLY